VDEVKRLLHSGVSPKTTAMQAIGYKEFAAALRGEESIQTALGQVKLRSRQYAKRQVTWFRRNEKAFRYEWKNLPDFADALQASTAFVRSNGIG